MYRLPLIFLFLLPLFFKAQLVVPYKSFDVYLGDTINRVDKNDLNQGRWVYFGRNKKGNKFRLYKNNQIVEEGLYLNGKKTKVWKTYHNTGKIKSEITYTNDVPNGLAKFYNADGKIIIEGILNDKKWVGSYSVYDVNGNKITKDEAISHKRSMLKFSGSVKKGRKPLEGVKIVVERNDFEIDEYTTKADGSFAFELELNFDYTLYFSKQSFTDQSISINTNVTSISDTTIYKLDKWKVSMYDNFAANATNDFFGFLLNSKSGRIYFSQRKHRFVSDGSYVHLFKKELKDISASTRFLLAKAAEDNEKLEIENLRVESENKLKEIELLKKEQLMKDAEIHQKQAEIAAQKLEAEKKAKDLELFEQDKKIQKLLLEQKQAEIEKQKMEADQKAKELENFAILKKVQELEIAQQKNSLVEKNQEIEKKNKEAELSQKELGIANREKEIKDKESKQNAL
ncbi:MAG: hypothetical protein IAF38_04445, partial [Bacteroidia bacterium]|nr:hypothetical protein [Bacteroidia bacterium]